jgi:23S rRNA (uridine2552-2'-O)-methyltransferase
MYYARTVSLLWNRSNMARRVTKEGGRGPRVRVRTKGLKASSTRWLERQLNDPYVAEAKRQGYRSRAAFKLAELDDKFRILKKNLTVLDLGAAPGGWSQVASERIGAGGRVVGVDILTIEPIKGVDLLTLDMLSAEAPGAIRAALSGPADVVLSDMAAPTTGHQRTDQLRTAVLFESALEIADDVLAPGGAFVGKVFQGGASPELLARLKRAFREVKHHKPPASRSASVELYLVALGFKG